MFQTILVLLDGSSQAEAALPMVARLAQNNRGNGILAYVVDVLSQYWPGARVTDFALAQVLMDTKQVEATAYLERIKAEVLV